jgi:hypothetical protein
LKKLFLMWSMVLMAALTVVACEKRENKAPPATSEQPAESTDTSQGTGGEQQPSETAPADQGGGQ